MKTESEAQRPGAWRGGYHWSSGLSLDSSSWEDRGQGEGEALKAIPVRLQGLIGCGSQVEPAAYFLAWMMELLIQKRMTREEILRGHLLEP